MGDGSTPGHFRTLSGQTGPSVLQGDAYRLGVLLRKWDVGSSLIVPVSRHTVVMTSTGGISRVYIANHLPGYVCAWLVHTESYDMFL